MYSTFYKTFEAKIFFFSFDKSIRQQKYSCKLTLKYFLSTFEYMVTSLC